MRLWGNDEDRVPLLLCSGVGCDDTYWLDIAAGISERRRVITWDYPFHGDSGPAIDRRGVTIASLARHAREVMQSAEIDRVALGGHSLGGQVVFEFFRQFRESTAALIPIAGSFRNTVGALYGSRGLGVLILSGLRLAARLRPHAAEAAWRVIMSSGVADPVGRAARLIGPVPVETMTSYFHHIAGVDLNGLLDMFTEGQAHSAEDLLGQIDVPVLIIHGAADVMTPFSLAEEMHRRIPGSELIRVAGGAHTLPGEIPGDIAETVEAFLATRVDG